MAASAVGSVELTDVGVWLVAVQCTLTITGSDIAAVQTTGIPYLRIDGDDGHGSFCDLPSTVPDDPLLFSFSFLHSVVSSSGETVSFTAEAFKLGTLVLHVDLEADAVLVGLPTDDGSPQAASVIVKPGSKLQIHRSGGV